MAFDIFNDNFTVKISKIPGMGAESCFDVYSVLLCRPGSKPKTGIHGGIFSSWYGICCHSIFEEIFRRRKRNEDINR
jgi:hypothetical protein